jgi:multidrug efflux pump subunit AcrB
MRGIVAFFLDRHLLVHVLTIGIVVLGLRAAWDAEREGFPAVELNLLFVSATLPGGSAADIESKIIVPIEDALSSVDGIAQYTSTSSDNIGVVRVELLDELDKGESAEVEADVRRALDAIGDFPSDMEDDPQVHRANPGRIPVMEVALSGRSDRLPEAAERLELALDGVDGLSSVNVVGVPDKEVRILVDAALARQHGVALTDVIGALQRRNVSSTGGTLETAGQRRQIVLRGEFTSAREAGETVLMFLPDGRALRVHDVARIEEGRKDDGLIVHTDGKPGVSLVIRKRESADIIDTARGIRAAVDATELPEGVTAVLVNDGSFLTSNRLKLMANNGLIGLTLVLICLFAFLNPRTAFWVAAGVPVVLLGVVALMPKVGMTLNLISMAGMVVVLGLLVDDAVVVSERIGFHRQQGMPPREAALKGTTTMMRAVTASALTTMVAFSPILELGGTPGKIAWNIPAVVVLALILSLAECFIILPVHVSGGRQTAPKPKRRFVQAMERAYSRVLVPVLRWRKLVLVVFGLVFVVTMGVIRPRLPFVLFPQDDSDALYVQVELPPGTPIERTEAVVTSLERQLPALVGSDLMATTSRIGHGDANNSDQTIGTASNRAAISVLCKPLDRLRTSAEWAVYLDEHLVVPPEADVTFKPRVVGPPMGRPVTVHISGNDDAVRRRVATAVAARLAGYPGVVDIEVDEEPGIRNVDLRPDWGKLSLLGLDAELVAITLKAGLHGIPVTEVRGLGETVSYRVQLDPISRGSLDSLLDTPLRGRTGRTVLLRDVVRPVEVPSVATIQHRGGQRTATVYAGFDPASGLTAHAMGQTLKREVFDAVADPAVRVYNGGEAVETAETLGNLLMVLTIAVLGICLVITVMLESVLDAIFVVATIPFGVAGVILAFFGHGQELSLFAMLGGIGLAGVVVNNAIVMVDAIKRKLAEAAEAGDDADEAMVTAVVERLRPILVTTISTLGAVLPTAYGLGGYDAVLSPMSLALGWGLVFSTSVTLLLVPCLFATAEDLRAFGRRLLALARRPAEA